MKGSRLSTVYGKIPQLALSLSLSLSVSPQRTQYPLLSLNYNIYIEAILLKKGVLLSHSLLK